MRKNHNIKKKIQKKCNLLVFLNEKSAIAYPLKWAVAIQKLAPP